jgi:U4/U6.U5 tri-snRNP-associated protein 1
LEKPKNAENFEGESFEMDFNLCCRIGNHEHRDRLLEHSIISRRRKRNKDVGFYSYFIKQAKGFLRPASKNLSLKDSRQGITSVVNVSLPSEKLLAWTKSNTGVQSILNKKKENAEGEKVDEPLSKEDIEQMKEEVKFLEEDNLNTGVAAALKAIRERGLANMEEQLVKRGRASKIANLTCLGRAKDETHEENLAKFGDIGKSIKLEYRDEKGRLMTPKEAFRYQCWMFHGKRPGKKKQAKRLKQEQTAKKALAIVPTQTATMRALERVQAATNQPYAVLSSSGKPK